MTGERRSSAHAPAWPDANITVEVAAVWRNGRRRTVTYSRRAAGANPAYGVRLRVSQGSVPDSARGSIAADLLPPEVNAGRARRSGQNHGPAHQKVRDNEDRSLCGSRSAPLTDE